MALDETPGVVLTLPRDQVRNNFTRDYGLRDPAAQTGPGTQPYVDGSVVADAVMPLYSDAVTIGRGTNLSTSSGTQLAAIGAAEGVFPRPAVGAIGFIQITAAAGGTYLQQGTPVLSKIGSIRFEVSTSALYLDQQEVPIDGVDTGAATNLPAGTAMQFPSPPPGCGPDAVVFLQSNGTGLSGGRPADDDAALRQLISDKRANPPASGNDAEYKAKIKATPGLSVQQPFTFPAIFGPGTMAYTFTLNPAYPGASRAPNPAQLASTLAYVIGQEPADDSVFACTLTEIGTRICLLVTWGAGASNWQDAVPWPAYLIADPVLVVASPAPTFTSFRLTTGTSTLDPQAGQTIGFWDPPSGLFKEMRIGAVSVVVSGLSWDITPDRTNGASDPSYIPLAGSPASPWSDSLQSVVAPVLSYMGGLGPGEQVTPFPDPGQRQRRQPRSPGMWSSTINSRLLAPIFALGASAIEDAKMVEPTDPFVTPVGVPGISCNLLTLGNLALYPL